MTDKNLSLYVRSELLAVCRLAAGTQPPVWASTGSFFSITVTDEEVSVVCPTDLVPPDLATERSWRCLTVDGPLDFSLVGVLAAISSCLARADVSLFVISTFDTDHILVAESDLERAVSALREAGHAVRSSGG